ASQKLSGMSKLIKNYAAKASDNYASQTLTSGAILRTNCQLLTHFSVSQRSLTHFGQEILFKAPNH
ncbi:MAG TPA: hypothetical protein VEF91_07380, partial [Verrucomicrobiae bacterium]|nr:hypothetical protein [Verrucomicrobiae bacterium]